MAVPTPAPSAQGGMFGGMSVPSAAPAEAVPAQPPVESKPAARKMIEDDLFSDGAWVPQGSWVD